MSSSRKRFKCIKRNDGVVFHKETCESVWKMIQLASLAKGLNSVRYNKNCCQAEVTNTNLRRERKRKGRFTLLRISFDGSMTSCKSRSEYGRTRRKCQLCKSSEWAIKESAMVHSRQGNIGSGWQIILGKSQKNCHWVQFQKKSCCGTK